MPGVNPFRQMMDGLYLVCVLVSGVALVLISAVIPWGVYTRYVLNHAASWPEPMAILLTIVMTFLGAAACYRTGMHMRVEALVNILPGRARRAVQTLSEAMVGMLSVFMVVWGLGLVETTWHQSIAEFPFVSVGATYLPIPASGIITLLFVIERVTIGPPRR